MSSTANNASTTVQIYNNFVEVTDCPGFIHSMGADVTFLLEGEPGIGKTHILREVAKLNGDRWRKPGDVFPEDKYTYVYIDCPTEGFSDRKMTIPVHDSKRLETYIADDLGIDPANPGAARPVVIMLDEIGKIARALMPSYTRLMLERTLGGIPLPEGSIVFATTNAASDNLGDNLKAHECNRLSIVPVRKPGARRWIPWAINNGVSNITITWVETNKHCLMSYMDGPAAEDNPFIFHPKRALGAGRSFVSPRSLVKADRIVSQRDTMSEATLRTLLTGTVGRAAADGLVACAILSASLIKTAEILAAPLSVEIPDDAMAQIMIMVNGANDMETNDDVAKFMEFVDRIPNREIQSIFFLQLVSNDSKAVLVRTNAKLKQWRLENYEMLG